MWFFNTEKVVDNVLDKDKGLLTQVGNWIGNQKLTPEEVIEFNKQTVTSVQSFVTATLNESTARSKARRGLANSWFQLQISVIMFACIAAPFDPKLGKFYLDLGTSTLFISITTAITIFYFGSHGIARYNESKKGK